MNKEERIKRFKSMSSMQRQELILKKMKERGIEVGSGIPNKKYDGSRSARFQEAKNTIHGFFHYTDGQKNCDSYHFVINIAIFLN